MRELLELRDVGLKDGLKYRLHKINLSIYSGDKIALLGENGSGKSTLIKVANGTLNPSVGKIKWKGRDLSRIKRREHTKIGTIWQDLRLIDELSVGQNINSGALGRNNLIWAIANLMGTIEKEKVISCLRASGLPIRIINSQVSSLSGGQKQRVAIARLLRQQSELILADEPLSNLDPKRVSEVINILIKRKSFPSVSVAETCLISLHRPDFISNFTRVIGMKDGSIVINTKSDKLTIAEINSLYK